MGRYEESIDEMAAWEVIPWLDATAVEMFRSAYAEGGVEGYLRAALEVARGRDTPPTAMAAIYVGLGDHDGAIAVLERAADERDPSLRALVAEPMLVPLRGDPRFAGLLERVGLASAVLAAEAGPAS